MNKRRLFKLTILFIIFGVPVFWYLFLQLFGENKFELPVLYKKGIETSCVGDSPTFIYREGPRSTVEENQFNRLEQYSISNSFGFIPYDNTCIASDFEIEDFILVSREGDIIGNYPLTIIEVDRAIAEGDLLIDLTKNGTNNTGE